MARITPDAALRLPRGRAEWLAGALVGAMVFLAALAAAGGLAAAQFAARWQAGAGALLLVQVPDPAGRSPQGAARLEAVLDALRAERGIARAAPMPAARLAELLAPWLGSDAAALPLPAVVEVTLARPPPPPGRLAALLAAIAPGAIAEDQATHVAPLLALAGSLALLGGVVAALVTGIAALLIAFAVSAALAAQRATIELLHALGATDGWIAHAFARRAGRVALAGAIPGGLLALPVVLGLATLGGALADAVRLDSPSVWLPPLLLPPLAWGLAHVAARVTVRHWLRRLW
jgi:cell division transport system permease protein